MILRKNPLFLELRAKAAKILDINVIGTCCTVDCIVGEIKKYYNDLAANEKSELIEIMKELNDLEKISEQELKDFYDNLTVNDDIDFL